ncbi:hypothetical protein V6N13_122069 [Hibiscus sabdariffa]
MFGNGRSESSTVGNSPIAICLDASQDRHAQISECSVKTRLLAKHQGSPHLIYTCGEDGLVQHIDLRTAVAIELLRCQSIGVCRVWNPVLPLYAIAIDPRNLNVFAVVGLDRYAHLYDIRKYRCPEYVVSGSDSGRVYIWKKKGGELVCAMKEHILEVDYIESHPHTAVLVSSGAGGIKIWTPNAIDKAKLYATKIEQDQHVCLVLVCVQLSRHTCWSSSIFVVGSFPLSIAFGVHILMPSAQLLSRTVVCG